MSFWRKLACMVLVLVLGASVAANWLAPSGYAKQYREATNAPPSRAHWLGTDEIGRDRFARVLYGTRISLLLAPAAALLSTLMAALVGGLAGYLGGVWARMAMAVTDLFLSLPWLFLLITAVLSRIPSLFLLKRLALLSPKLQRTLLEGKAPARLMLQDLLAEPPPILWSDQEVWFARVCRA